MKALVGVVVEVNDVFKNDRRLHLDTIEAGLSAQHSHRWRAARLWARSSSHASLGVAVRGRRYYALTVHQICPAPPRYLSSSAIQTC